VAVGVASAVGYDGGMDDREYDVPNNPYVGMMTNERLFNVGLPDEWDRAARHRDRPSMVRLLVQVGATLRHAEQIADAVLASRGHTDFSRSAPLSQNLAGSKDPLPLAPNQNPRDVWEELVKQGQLKHAGHGMYSLGP
jgi:hypothetical protein